MRQDDRQHVLKTGVTLLVALACALAPLSVVAQQNGPAKSDPTDAYDAYFMSDEHREKIYEHNRKSAGTATLLTLALPGLGNVYAEQYMFAGIAMTFMVFAATFVGYGLSTRQRGIVVLGAGTAGIAYVGGLGTSLYGVIDFNRELRENLKVERTSVDTKWTPALTLRF